VWDEKVWEFVALISEQAWCAAVMRAEIDFDVGFMVIR
jgi:hypothetical protein